MKSFPRMWSVLIRILQRACERILWMVAGFLLAVSAVAVHRGRVATAIEIVLVACWTVGWACVCDDRESEKLVLTWFKSRMPGHHKETR